MHLRNKSTYLIQCEVPEIKSLECLVFCRTVFQMQLPLISIAVVIIQHFNSKIQEKLE